jgi:hypothetical protein
MSLMLTFPLPSHYPLYIIQSPHPPKPQQSSLHFPLALLMAIHVFQVPCMYYEVSGELP